MPKPFGKILISFHGGILMLKEKTRMTYDDYLALPDEKRYELMEGELFMVPAPDFYHQIVSGNIQFYLMDFVKKRNLGVVVDAPVDVVMSPEDVLQPDILFISRENRHIITKKNVSGAPDLVIEILSPSTQERDKLVKRDIYSKYGVKEYWIVDPVGKNIEVMTSGSKGYKLHAIFLNDEVLTSPLIEGFSLPLKEVFTSF